MLNHIKKLFCILFLISCLSSTANALELIKPERLKAGDTVGLVASGFRVPEDIQIQYAVERLQALGLKVKLGKYVFNRYGYFSATDEQRAEDFNHMIRDKEIKAIVELRGGWGSNRILNLIDYKAIKDNPKIIMGFSDITALLLAIYHKTDLVTFHGPVGTDPWPEFTVNYVKKVLFQGKEVVFSNPKEADEDDLIQTKNRAQTINSGVATGRLLGGNLTVIASMLGSSYLPKWNGAILFVEDVGEDIYKVDRMLEQLKAAGVLNRISGFIFGQCKDCTVGSGTTSYGSLTLMHVVSSYIKPLKIPAWYGAMIGHDPKMFVLPEGVMVEINADKGTIKMLEAAVR
ncbi:MAG: LD-carboxypeptidase [Gammaproteobacteria bacterium]